MLKAQVLLYCTAARRYPPYNAIINGFEPPPSTDFHPRSIETFLRVFLYCAVWFMITTWEPNLFPNRCHYMYIQIYNILYYIFSEYTKKLNIIELFVISAWVLSSKFAFIYRSYMKYRRTFVTGLLILRSRSPRLCCQLPSWSNHTAQHLF